MICFCFLLYYASSEWVGNLTAYPSNRLYSGLRQISDHYWGKINMNISICQDQDCTDNARIYNYSSEIINTINEDNVSIAVVVTDADLNSSLTIPVFLIASEDGTDLLAEQVESIKISYNFDYHCLDLFPVLVIVGVFLPGWVLLIAAWLYNNYRLNSMNADLFHKFTTSILIFKLLNIAASFIIRLSCPIEERMTFEFLDLFFKQTRSLYETSFFAYLLLVSKGWVLVLNTMDRKEFNYLVIIVILVYIFDSAVNIISIGMQEITLILYAIVISHIILFGVRTVKAINTQASVIEETGMDLLFPVTRMKRRIFFMFLVIVFGYFLGELAVHYTFAMKDQFEFSRLAWFCFFHEILEILTISGIFYLYRARDMGRFFTVEFDGRPGFHRILPFYEAKKECEEGVMLAVILPRNKVMIAKAE